MLGIAEGKGVKGKEVEGRVSGAQEGGEWAGKERETEIICYEPTE